MFNKKSLVKYFGNKVVTIPPSLKVKNAEKITKFKSIREQNIKSLLQSEKLADNYNEYENIRLKDLYEKNIILNTKKLTLKYFSIQNESSNTNQINNLMDFTSKILSVQEYNTFFNEIIKCKKNLSNEDIKLNEAVFKLLLDKISKISMNSGKKNELS